MRIANENVTAIFIVVSERASMMKRILRQNHLHRCNEQTMRCPSHHACAIRLRCICYKDCGKKYSSVPVHPSCRA